MRDEAWKGETMKVLLALVLIMMLAGCAAPPGQRADNTDFLTKHVSTNMPVTEAYANLRQGFRYCGPASYGIPDCRAPGKDGTVLCDVYPGDTASGRTNRILGRIQLSPAAAGTQAILRVQSHAANKEEVLTGWEIFMSGRVREACP